MDQSCTPPNENSECDVSNVILILHKTAQPCLSIAPFSPSNHKRGQRSIIVYLVRCTIEYLTQETINGLIYKVSRPQSLNKYDTYDTGNVRSKPISISGAAVAPKQLYSNKSNTLKKDQVIMLYTHSLFVLFTHRHPQHSKVNN